MRWPRLLRRPARNERRFEGTCDVCGAPLALVWDGVIDIGIEDGRVYTWIRHPGGPTDACWRYFSRVYEVKP